jgi:adenosylhomocysteine nucleosidase
LREKAVSASIDGNFSMLLVTFAVPHESRDFQRTAAASGVRVLHTGIGIDSAARSLRRALEDHRPSTVISSGFAGGLDPALRIGDMIADSAVSSQELLQAVPVEIRRGRICTASNAIDSPEAKVRLHRETGANAVDMETTAIAAECARAGVPLLVLRAISDAVGDSIPVPLEVAWDLVAQRPRPLRLCVFLAQNPTRIEAFVRFLRQTNHAAKNLGEALEGIVERMRTSQADFYQDRG